MCMWYSVAALYYRVFICSFGVCERVENRRKSEAASETMMYQTTIAFRNAYKIVHAFKSNTTKRMK